MPNPFKVATQVKKKKLTQRERESRMQRFILLTGTVVIVSVIALVSSGYYFTTYRPLHEIVLRINGQEYDMAYYVSALKFFGTNQDIIELLEQNELIRQAADKLGISVTDDEAKEEIGKRNIPLNDVNVTFIKAEILANKMLDEYFDDKAPISEVQREVMGMFLEDEVQAKEIRDRILAGEDYKALAAQYSLDKASKDASGYLDWHPKGAFTTAYSSSILDDVVFNGTVGEFSAPAPDSLKTKNTGYWLMKLVTREDEEAHVMAILLPDRTTANKTLARLEAGEDFITVGKEVSQMPGAKDNGGDLGTIKKGERGVVFDDFAFKPEVAPGTLSGVIRDDQVTTRGGYWLVKVLAEDKDKTLSQTDHDSLRDRLYYDWVASLWADQNNKIEAPITDEQKVWAINQSKK